MTPSPLFRELRFYLTRTLSAETKAQLTQLIEQNGGEVSRSPAGATQLVDCEKLDARFPEWISTEFITDSVAFRALQDPGKYSGKIFQSPEDASTPKRRGRAPYTIEEDARMLHFAKLHGWKSMETVPESAWRVAEAEKVTTHTAQSMHQHFRKQLRGKTNMEQRIIMAKAAAVIRAQLLEQEEKAEPEDVGESPVRRLSSTGFRGAATPESQTSRRTPSSASPLETMTPGSGNENNRGKEVEERKLNARDRRTRSRKPTSPLRISQRLERSEGGPVLDATLSYDEVVLSPTATDPSLTLTATPPPLTATTDPSLTLTATPPAPSVGTPATPATSEVAASPYTPVVSKSPTLSSMEGSQSSGKRQQKRKRRTPSSQERRSARSEIEDSDASVASKAAKTTGLYFGSVWTGVIQDSSKRRMLQPFFEPPSEPVPSAEASRAESVTSDASGVEEPAMSEQSRSIPVEQATETTADEIICQLQFGTNHNSLAVVNALYFCNGDPEVAEAFLRGASPLQMWSPEDDLLLVNLVADEGTTRAVVDAAVARGDFAAMQVPRNTDAILKRVQFLR